jgi:cytidylate kinase
MIIAIDGPAGSGKSSVAKSVATRLGFRYLDTGAMYRAVTYRALQTGVDPSDGLAVAQVVAESPIEFTHVAGDPFPTGVRIAGDDVTAQIRTPAVDDAVSAVARLGVVREAMVMQQRALSGADDIVVEGRDIGTVVFPDAELKVFLTASATERARRRAVQQAESGIESDSAEVHDAILRRDAADSNRELSPLTPAPDAVILDTTALTFEQVVDRVCEIARERRA